MCRDIFTIWLGRSREMWRLEGSRTGTPSSRSSGRTAWQEQICLDRLEFLPDRQSIFIKAKFVYQPRSWSHHLVKAFEKPERKELQLHSCKNALTNSDRCATSKPQRNYWPHKVQHFTQHNLLQAEVSLGTLTTSQQSLTSSEQGKVLNSSTSSWTE